ncbi:restriction endonuclease subunit S [Bombilactobacillus mellis]|uniref:restriction endonuclease subunit S n=1 Tax=Bombilactobacillus mellis TaxID=1218508 RepID=UPI0022472EA2|nr:restriction endonuclease subunit S [Bombilactobacillus mellis]MCX0278460.1 restriction endonuclease subunit S [Bombilactobacillus mellis]
MNKHKLVPNIRFKGFENEWRDEKLGKITKYVKGYAFESKLYTENGIRLIKATDLTNKKIRKENENATYIPQTEATKFKKYVIHQKDIIITTVGSKTKLKNSSVGRAIYVDNSKNYLLNQNLVKVTALNDFDSFFIYTQLEQPKYINYISKIERGNANQANIEIKDLWNYPIKVSNIKEQQKISDLFIKLDKLIDLHQQKIERLELLKKALLQKLFPKHDAKIPELRFKGYEKDWDERKLNSITKRLDNYRKPITANKRLSGQIPYYGANGIQDYVKGYTHEGEFVLIAEDGANDVRNYPVRFVKGYIWVNNHAHVLQAKIATSNNLFLSYSLKNKNLLPYLVGSGRMKLNADVLMNLLLKIPSLKEQQKIGNLLSKVDQLIELENKKLQNFQQLKKCLLQNMFVE